MTDRNEPLRKCIRCNEMHPKRELIRIVRDKDGAMNVDMTGKLAGRGAYICKSRACLEAAAKSKRLEKAFRCAVPQDIYAGLKEQIPEDR